MIGSEGDDAAERIKRITGEEWIPEPLGECKWKQRKKFKTKPRAIEQQGNLASSFRGGGGGYDAGNGGGLLAILAQVIANAESSCMGESKSQGKGGAKIKEKGKGKDKKENMDGGAGKGKAPAQSFYIGGAKKINKN